MTENNNTYISSAADIPPSPPKPTFSAGEIVTAFLSLLFGYGFVKLVMTMHYGIGASIFFLAFMLFAIIFLTKSGVSFKAGNLVSLGVIFAFSLSFLLSNDPLVNFLNSLLVPAMIAYWIYSVCYGIGSIREKLYYDFTKSVFAVPFGNFGTCATGISASARKTGNGKNIFLAIVGLIVAIPLTLVVIGLLSSSDAMFESVFEDIFENFGMHAIIFIVQVMIGVPIAFYLFGLLYGSVHKTTAEATDEYCENASEKRRILSDILLCSAVTPICILYVIFFVIQVPYFLSAFTNTLPDGYSYAEYARRGFFELSTVAVINLCAIAVMQAFSKKKEGKTSRGVSVYTIILSAFTLLLIATALSKMFMYIGNYGLTLKRLHTTWFMILLALVFVMIIIRAAVKKFNLAKGITYAFVVMMAILTFGDFHGNIVRYNVYAYQNGMIDNIDISMFYKLSDEAARYAVPLLEDEDLNVARAAATYIADSVNASEYEDIRGFNIPEYVFRQSHTEYSDAEEVFYERVEKLYPHSFIFV